MIIGFTGTRDGLTIPQLRSLVSLIRVLRPFSVHHGCCYGADLAFARIVSRLSDCMMIGHPSNIREWVSDKAIRLCSRGCIYAPEHPLVRNKRIVNRSDTLIACPKGPETIRSGTWSTVRYARRIGIPVKVIWPDGKVEDRK